MWKPLPPNRLEWPEHLCFAHLFYWYRKVWSGRSFWSSESKMARAKEILGKTPDLANVAVDLGISSTQPQAAKIPNLEFLETNEEAVEPGNDAPELFRPIFEWWP